jgi:hypothetical protein
VKLQIFDSYQFPIQAMLGIPSSTSYSIQKAIKTDFNWGKTCNWRILVYAFAKYSARRQREAIENESFCDIF